jgi:hypothetical protein
VEGINMARLPRKYLSIERLGLPKPARLMVLQGEIEGLLDREHEALSIGF